MNDKIQELTDKLYSQGLSKGKAEGERLVEEARAEAARIIADAKSEAEKIISAANADASQLKAKTESDIKMAAGQSVNATKQAIEKLVTAEICGKPVNAAMKDTEFLKTIIVKVAESFSSQESKDINIVLPDSLKNELDAWVKDELTKSLSKGAETSFSNKIKGGFKIGPKDGAWFISFTDETMEDLIKEYIRPVTRKILFGE